jgi:predicted nucleic acid-binding protein
MLVLADTGILLRFIERTDPAHDVVRHAVRILANQGDEIVMALQNVVEFWNVCTRPTTARGGFGLSLAETDRRLKVLERLFPVLAERPDVYQRWRHMIVSFGVQGRQVHDCRLAATMLVHGISHILTLNETDFARYPITALSPSTITHLP